MENEVSDMNKWTKVSANIVMTCVIIWLLIPLVATIIYSLFEDWTGILTENRQKTGNLRILSIDRWQIF